MRIPVYIVNLPSRLERKAFATRELTGREEFEFKIEEATADETGAISLWLTLQRIVHRAEEKNWEYFWLLFRRLYPVILLTCCSHAVERLNILIGAKNEYY